MVPLHTSSSSSFVMPLCWWIASTGASFVVFVGVFLGCSARAILQRIRLAGSQVNLSHACGCVISRDLDPYDLELIYFISLICLYISLPINLSVFISIYLFIYLCVQFVQDIVDYFVLCGFFLCGIEILCWSGLWWFWSVLRPGTFSSFFLSFAVYIFAVFFLP